MKILDMYNQLQRYYQIIIGWVVSLMAQGKIYARRFQIPDKSVALIFLVNALQILTCYANLNPVNVTILVVENKLLGCDVILGTLPISASLKTDGPDFSAELDKNTKIWTATLKWINCTHQSNWKISCQNWGMNQGPLDDGWCLLKFIQNHSSNSVVRLWPYASQRCLMKSDRYCRKHFK